MGGRKARSCLLLELKLVEQCKHKPIPAAEVVNAATSGSPHQNGQISVSDVHIAPSSTTNASAPSVDEDGFTMVSRHKKRGPIKLQSKKQKPKGGAHLVNHHVTHVEVNKEPIMVPIAPKKVTSGFNYSRAVQGGKGNLRQQRDSPLLVAKTVATCVPTRPPARSVPGVGSTNRPNDMGLDSANRFSVLDIPSSIKFNKLIEDQDDLYPPDKGLEDSMDLEVNPLNSNGNVDYMANGKYGISDAQKQVILKCMQDFKYVQAEAVEEWSQGEWDFFTNKCMEMGLDPKNSYIPRRTLKLKMPRILMGLFGSCYVSSQEIGILCGSSGYESSHPGIDMGQFVGFGLFKEEVKVY
ncbi:hypothetical protein L1987_47767 [Smallanthus sonchifolius]|uniref:Uncharacterized protein n=1 Tax=Smallanthus sonchifolius TaxID=185202 RepID=A0ACB9FQ45_9ASTR|nr:hypothetical protein L1987_47767 [Smallanthus sonchifolius]